MSATSVCECKCEFCKQPIEERTESLLPHLHTVCNARKNHKCQLLKKLTKCQLQFISDCCKGILHRHITFPVETYKKLKRFRKDIILLADVKKSLKTKRAAIVKKNGGFLSLILPALATAVFSLVGNLISKKINK